MSQLTFEDKISFCGIYGIVNKINKKMYIGSSINTKSRKSSLETYHNKLIDEDIKKYGGKNFEFKILEECEKKLLPEKEKEYILKYNSLTPNGYNVRLITNNSISYNRNKSTGKSKPRKRRMIALKVPIEINDKFSKACQQSYISKTQAIVNLMLEYIKRKETANVSS